MFKKKQLVRLTDCDGERVVRELLWDKEGPYAKRFRHYLVRFNPDGSVTNYETGQHSFVYHWELKDSRKPMELNKRAKWRRLWNTHLAPAVVAVTILAVIAMALVGVSVAIYTFRAQILAGFITVSNMLGL
jgi:hypothetical protein